MRKRRVRRPTRRAGEPAPVAERLPAAESAPAPTWLTMEHPARPGFGLVSSGAAPAAGQQREEQPDAKAAAPTIAPTKAQTMAATPGPRAAAPPVEATGPVPLAPITGTAEPVELEAYGNGGPASVQLRGVTHASFRSGFRTEDAAAAPATGCARCAPGQCVHATGTLVADYDVSTSVSLPAVPPGLTDCQRARVRTAIDTVLAPHEQQHVRAFETFRGTTSRPFDLTTCRNQVDAEVRRLFETERRARQGAAQALSDALDPFQVDVDLDCGDAAARAEPAPGPGHDTPDGEEEEA